MIHEGPRNAKILLLGEAPGFSEIKSGKPFSGASGWEMDKMLQEAHIARANCFLCNVIDKRPPSGNASDFFATKTKGKKLGHPFINGRYVAEPDLHLAIERIRKVISAISPNVVICLGDLALWAMTGESGIMKWRGSIMESLPDEEGKTFKVIPTYNPAFVLRNWPVRSIVVTDFRRAFANSLYPEIRKPERSYLIKPTIDQAIAAIRRARGTEFSCDIEFWHGHIACVGFGFNTKEAACIPLMCVDKPEGYWTFDEEKIIVKELKQTLTDPESKPIFQHGHYDLQMFTREWGYIPRVDFDTMVAYHVIYPEMRKALDFMASMMCQYYRFWKDDGKNWDANIDNEDVYWTYNCDDCCYTYEIAQVEKILIERNNLQRPFEIQMSLYIPILMMMLRGVKIDVAYKNKMRGDLQNAMRDRSIWFEKVLGHPLNPLSNAPTGQMRRLFYDDLKAPLVLNRKTKQPSLDDEALEVIKQKKPALKLLCDAVLEFRSLNTFKGTFAEAKISPDNRVRFSINESRVVTFRFSTNKNIDGEGMNTQNIPKGHEKED